MGFETDYVLPMTNTDEYKGFHRKLSELEMWKNLTACTLLADFTSFFACFEVEVENWILVIYFVFVLGFLCKAKLQHMVKYKYVPWDLGLKAKYGQNK